MVVFYLLAPIPTLIARRYNDNPGSSNATLECAIFITMGVVVSAFALPIVFARTDIVSMNICNVRGFPNSASSPRTALMFLKRN